MTGRAWTWPTDCWVRCQAAEPACTYICSAHILNLAHCKTVVERVKAQVMSKAYISRSYGGGSIDESSGDDTPGDYDLLLPQLSSTKRLKPTPLDDENYFEMASESDSTATDDNAHESSDDESLDVADWAFAESVGRRLGQLHAQASKTRQENHRRRVAEAWAQSRASNVLALAAALAPRPFVETSCAFASCKRHVEWHCFDCDDAGVRFGYCTLHIGVHAWCHDAVDANGVSFQPDCSRHLECPCRADGACHSH